MLTVKIQLQNLKNEYMADDERQNQTRMVSKGQNIWHEMWYLALSFLFKYFLFKIKNKFARPNFIHHLRFFKEKSWEARAQGEKGKIVITDGSEQ